MVCLSPNFSGAATVEMNQLWGVLEPGSLPTQSRGASGDPPTLVDMLLTVPILLRFLPFSPILPFPSLA